MLSDYDQLSGWKIRVQSFDSDTVFTTVGMKVERNVPAGSLFICDRDKPVALAGIMGGLNSEISANTTTRLNWRVPTLEPVGIRKTSKSLGLQTDSSYRFERGIDPEITYAAAMRCAEIIADIAGGQN